MSTVTRREISACTREAFGSGWVGRDELSAAARSAGARPEVVAILERLSPHVRVCGLPDLLLLLPDLPEGDGGDEGGETREAVLGDRTRDEAPGGDTRRRAPDALREERRGWTGGSLRSEG
ncbi:hypothetical protein ACFPM3_03460 [Streptomyces coeruleoprunus]|uniref:Uncharacterized protein n=1 Tax=Streptomyces coeruleoprunus TaxID=285563 RepID=A0ABV9X8P6_9ACTN